MFDAVLRRRLDPLLDRVGRALAAWGARADAITVAGLVVGLGAAALIASGRPLWGLLLIALSRLADGLDGAVARATRATDFGGFIDIVADFLFYGAVPLGFVLLDPARNGVPGAALLLSFYVNGASFLGFAVLAERQRMTTTARGLKTLFFSGGLLEGSETIAFFVLLCLWPAAFPALASSFAALCFVTAGARVHHAWQVFGKGRGT